MLQVRNLGRLVVVTAVMGWLSSGHPAVADPLSLFEPDHGQNSIFERFIHGEAAAPGPVEEPSVAPELPPALRRQIVAYPSHEASGTIIIDTTNTHLYFVLGDGKAIRYGIGVGRDGFTWSGVETVIRKAEWPDWHPPAEMLQRQPYLPRVMAGGPGNPLGARALYLGGTEYRIHGTNQPASIGARSLASQTTGGRPAAPAFTSLNADMASFSQAQEMEADRIGATVAWHAGYDPYGTVRFLDALGRNESLIQSVNQQSAGRDVSHPATADRLKAALMDAELRGASSGGERDRDFYLASIAGLLFGADPSEGVVRGRQFLQPRLGFSFTAPVGFVLQKLRQGAVGAEPAGTNAMHLDIVSVPAEMTPAEYLSSGALENVEASSLRELTIDGRPAATATAHAGGWTLRLFAVRFGGEVCRLIFAARALSPELDRAFLEAADSIRPMSSADRRSAQPLRLRIHTVQPGDTAESLAAGMATNRPLERFLILNGMRAGQPLHPGDRVKVVTGDDMT